MKSVLIYLPAIPALFVVAQNMGNIKKNTAEVEQVEGLFVFYRTGPNTDYQNLENHKIGLMRDDKPSLLFDKPTTRTREKCLSENGMIIFNDMS